MLVRVFLRIGTSLGKIHLSAEKFRGPALCAAYGSKWKRPEYTSVPGPVPSASIDILRRAGDRNPRWSPDSRQIVFDFRPEGNTDIFVISTAGGPPKRLTSEPAQDITPSWSGDGRWIYFASNRSGTFEVWRMPAEGGEAAPLTRQGGVAPIESPDGRYVYYAKSRDYATLWRVPVSGGEETQVFDRLNNWSSFAMVKDGIYFIPYPQRSSRAWLHFAGFPGGASKPVAAIAGTPHAGLSVSPDGRSILFAIRSQFTSDLMLVENFR